MPFARSVSINLFDREEWLEKNAASCLSIELTGNAGKRIDELVTEKGQIEEEMLLFSSFSPLLSSLLVTLFLFSDGELGERATRKAFSCSLCPTDNRRPVVSTFMRRLHTGCEGEHRHLPYYFSKYNSIVRSLDELLEDLGTNHRVSRTHEPRSAVLLAD